MGAIVGAALLSIIITQIRIDQVTGQSGTAEQDIEDLGKIAEVNKNLTINLGNELRGDIDTAIVSQQIDTATMRDPYMQTNTKC